MNQTKPGKFRKDLIYPAVISLLLPAPFLLGSTVLLNYLDMYYYLKLADTIQDGELAPFLSTSGFRTAAFPLLLHWSLGLFGRSLLALKYLETVCLALICLQSWAIGRLLMKNNSGLLAAILVCTSYTFAHFLYFPHLDMPLLVLMNLGLLVLAVACKGENPETKWLILSGLAIGATCLFKETAILLLIVFPSWSLLHRTFLLSTTLWRWTLQLLSAGVVLVPVLIGRSAHLMVFAEKIYRESFAPSGAGPHSLDVSLVRLVTYPLYPVYWQWQDLLPVPTTLIAVEHVFLLATAACYVFVSPAPANAKRFLLAILIAFLPLYVYVTIQGYKIRQLLMMVFVLYLTSAFAVWWLAEVVGKRCLKVVLDPRWRRTVVWAGLGSLYTIRLVVFLAAFDHTMSSAHPLKFHRSNPLPAHQSHFLEPKAAEVVSRISDSHKWVLSTGFSFD
ncbi:MAG: glycosyltransferase family 39 protein [Thermodesulfobacteriota bacterium]